MAPKHNSVVIVNMDVVGKMNLPDRKTPGRRRSRRMETSAACLEKHVREYVADEFLDELTQEIPDASVYMPKEIPDTRRTIEMAPLFPDPAQSSDVPEPASVKKRGLPVHHRITPTVGISLDDVFQQLTGDPNAHVPKDAHVERLLGLDAFSSRPVELCDCEILMESFSVRALHVLHSGAIILPPKVLSSLIDQLTITPVNPIGFCIGCGKQMDAMVEVEAPLMEESLPAACCRGMQKAVIAERAELPVERLLRRHRTAILQGVLRSPDGEHCLRHDHCGWCGTWFQKFLLTQRIRRVDKGWGMTANA